MLPGLWDCHTHFMGSREFDLARLAQEPVALRAARCARDLVNALDAGFTSVREVGGLGVYLARAVAEGMLDGPAVYAAGAVLSTTGGHGDLHCYPLSWMEEFARTDGTFRLADGTAECMRAVREQLRRGAAVIKVCASGGVLSDLDDPIHQQFTGSELRAIVEVAGLAERVVAAHCHGKPGIMAALEAGVATIEHGTYLDAEACDAMRETGAILVPTRSIIEDILGHLGQVPPYAATKLVAIAQTHADAMTLAIERGVTIAVGTDIGLTGLDRPNSWGTNGSELAHLVALGHDAAAGHRGGDGHRAAHARAAGAAQRPAGRRVRRRPHHGGRRPAGRHRGAGPPGGDHRRLDPRPPGQGRGDRGLA